MVPDDPISHYHEEFGRVRDKQVEVPGRDLSRRSAAWFIGVDRRSSAANLFFLDPARKSRPDMGRR
jgi:hypothetical protein